MTNDKIGLQNHVTLNFIQIKIRTFITKFEMKTFM